MTLGMSVATFTILHVLISLIGIVTGFVVVFAFLKAKLDGRMTAVFLSTTALTSITGFGFPFDHLLPSHIVGIISMVVLAVAAVALYAMHLSGVWRAIYVIGAVMALYFNVFVLVVQAFLKVPPLHALAPNGSEPPFAIAQGVVLALFVWLGIKAVKGFRAEKAPLARAAGA